MIARVRDSQAMLNMASLFWSSPSQPIGSERLRDVCARPGSGIHLFCSHSIGRNLVTWLLHCVEEAGQPFF